MRIMRRNGFVSLSSEVLAGIRFLSKIPAHLKYPFSYPQARSILKWRLENREAQFLSLVKTIHESDSRFPLKRLLVHAGCAYGDVENSIRTEGLEGALESLFHKGVYLTVDEFKGRREVRRGSLKFFVNPSELQNPSVSSRLSMRTSGSRSKGTPAPISMAYIRSRSIDFHLHILARGGLDWAYGVWGVPGGAAVNHLLESCGCGVYPQRWFSSVDPYSQGLHPRYRWSARALRWASLVTKIRLPRIQYVPVDEPQPIFDWISDVIQAGQSPHLIGYTSSVVRLCLHAFKNGVDLKGTQFTVTGEPLSEMRFKTICNSGAQVSNRYGSIEVGTLGYGCLNNETSDEVHFLSDRLALFQVAKGQFHDKCPPGSLFVTTLEPATPYLLLNVALGDQAEVIKRSCGCPHEDFGWTTHLQMIHSYEKLTSEGMAFLSTDLSRIIDEVLPERFGGGPTHYQIVEEEDEEGRASLRLIVHPEVGPIDAEVLIDTFLNALESTGDAEKLMGLLWRETRVVKVDRCPPIATQTGKILHFYLRNSI